MAKEPPWEPEDGTKRPFKKAEAMFKVGTLIGAIQYVMLKILYFIHPHLHFLVANSLSAGSHVNTKEQNAVVVVRQKYSF